MSIRFRFLVVVSLFGAPVASGLAAESAMDWLMKMSDAVSKNSYDGTFIYRHGDQIEAMRIIHLHKNGSSRERLVSLNGEAREVIRNNRDVICYLPDKRSVVVEHRKTGEKNFPALLPDNVGEVSSNYNVGLGGTDRVATRKARMVFVKPRDSYRYGYQLWADEQTGLMLKANLIDEKRRVVEQFMFTRIDIGKPIPASDLDPGYSGKKWEWHRENNKTVKGADEKNWKAESLPRGYRLTRQMSRHLPMRDMVVQHLVYSDGLAAVSVFIEPHEKKQKKPMTGATGMGAVNAFVTTVNGHQVTVVGEVPLATVEMIGQSISYQ
jgi:sigma-E factor negative regulatory protein RseB